VAVTLKLLSRAASPHRAPNLKHSGSRQKAAKPEEAVPEEPADHLVFEPYRIGHNDGPPLDLIPPPRWGRAKEAARHYGVGLTTIYAWLNAGRFTTRKVGGIRLLLIGAARDIDIEERPLPNAVPVSRRPENVGKTWRGRKAGKEPPEPPLTADPPSRRGRPPNDKRLHSRVVRAPPRTGQ
jgi:hypothetical protein